MGAASKEKNKQERTDFKEIVKTLLGSDPYIIKEKYCEDNYLLFDYINLEQDLYRKTLTLRQMMTDKEFWNKVEKS